ncbi:MAG TPA: hypothetical protein VL284_15095 [Thermoanaerobaculia bacterium]|nr:hypothetical protein [Thermoanaerobaculia bacterium]
MASRTGDDEPRRNSLEFDDDDTLREVGEERDFAADDDEADPADRRRDPLRLPH